MREIKFRAWNTFTKQMIDLQKITPFAIAEPLEGLFIPKDDALKVMQFTGLKDKNGKEIYEGDIIKFGKEVIDSVEWSEECAGFWTSKGAALYQEAAYMNEGAEVIGNIYENPDLLTSK